MGTVDFYEQRNSELARFKKTYHDQYIGESYKDYKHYKCTECPIRQTCMVFDQGDKGCSFRKDMFDKSFQDMKHEDADTIIFRQREILSRAEIELMFKLAQEKGNISRNTIELLNVILNNYYRVYEQLKGRTVTVKKETTIELDESEIQKIEAYVAIAKKGKDKKKDLTLI